MMRGMPCGFTRNDLLASLAVLTLIGVVIYAMLSGQRRHASKVYCINKLKWIGICERNYAEDHNGNSPWMLSTTLGGSLEYRDMGTQVFRHFQVQSNYIQACSMIVCPQDTRQAAANLESLANTNISYFVGLDSRPNLPMSVLAGDRNITPDSSVILQANQSAPPSWIKSVGLHGDKGHLVFGDGHVEEVESAGLSNAVQRTGIATNRFAVP